MIAGDHVGECGAGKPHAGDDVDVYHVQVSAYIHVGKGSKHAEAGVVDEHGQVIACDDTVDDALDFFWFCQVCCQDFSFDGVLCLDFVGYSDQAFFAAGNQDEVVALCGQFAGKGGSYAAGCTGDERSAGGIVVGGVGKC